MRLPDCWAEWTCMDEIGSGSYGTVYELYREKEDGREENAAMKVIEVKKGFEEVFLREVRILELLKNNRHILQILDYYVEEKSEVGKYSEKKLVEDTEKDIELKGEKGGDFLTEIDSSHIYILMPFLETLVDYMVTHEMDEDQVVRMGIELCEALEACQKAGIVHRDVKPSNIMVDQDTFLLGDFGFAVQDSGDKSMKGTYAYMAPEVYHKQAYGYTADLYSLGLVMYRLMNNNREAFVDMDKQIVTLKDREEAMRKRLEGHRLPPPCNAGKDLSQIILKACQPNPAKRYQSASKMKQDLLRLQSGTYIPQSRRKGIRIGIGIIMGAFMAMGAGFYISGYSNVSQLIIQLTDSSEVQYKLDRNGTLTISNIDAIGTISGWGIDRKNIRKIIFQEGLRTIGEKAFADCPNLESVSFPESLELIELEAFSGCRKLNLEDEDIPDNIAMIEANAFTGTAWAKRQGDYLIIAGILTEYQGADQKLVLPADKNLRVLSSFLFQGNDQIESIKLPDTVEEIGDCAFYGCAHLKKIDMPESLTAFGDSTFNETPWAEEQGAYVTANHVMVAWQSTDSEADIPQGVTAIGPGVYAGNMDLKKITIPDSVEWIAEDAFLGCRNLEEVVLPPSLQKEEIVDVFADTKWWDQLGWE